MQRYKLKTTTVAVHLEPAGPVTMIIPPGAVLRVHNDLVNAAGLVTVEWDGKTVQLFAVDLHSRAALINARGA